MTTSRPRASASGGLNERATAIASGPGVSCPGSSPTGFDASSPADDRLAPALVARGGEVRRHVRARSLAHRPREPEHGRIPDQLLGDRVRAVGLHHRLYTELWTREELELLLDHDLGAELDAPLRELALEIGVHGRIGGHQQGAALCRYWSRSSSSRSWSA
jgi:hypothetical protein